MATLRVFKKPEGFTLPDYQRRNNNTGTGMSFVKKVQTDMEGYNKFIIGRYFEETVFISKPSETGIEEIRTTRPISITCQVYLPTGTSENNIFVVGSGADSLDSELMLFSNTDDLHSISIDMAKLEKNSFTTGIIKLMGHRYNLANDTVNYNVRKIDGAPFRRHDPEFVSCDITDKEVLEVMLILDGNPNFHVHEDGKITRRGRTDTTVPEFELLKTVYDIIKKVTS